MIHIQTPQWLLALLETLRLKKKNASHLDLDDEMQIASGLDDLLSKKGPGFKGKTWPEKQSRPRPGGREENL